MMSFLTNPILVPFGGATLVCLGLAALALTALARRDRRRLRRRLERDAAKAAETREAAQAALNEALRREERLKAEAAARDREAARFEADLASTRAALKEAEAARAAAREELVQRGEAEKALQARLADLDAARERMTLEFKDIAGALMERHGAAFKQSNREQIDQLLGPLKTRIETFEQQVAKSQRDSRDQHVALKEQIVGLSELSARMSAQTENLTRALKGSVQKQGAWGEMVLETVLKRSGLREGEEYSSQETHRAEDGGRLRTDYIVNLPNGERIIIDAKVSLNAFERFVNAEDDEARARHLADHAQSVKAHIKTLAEKAYHERASARLDFTIMFVPIEAALGAAMQKDGEIGFFAADNKVAMATPTTLTIALKTVAAIWRVERQNRNAADIADRAGKLYDKFVGFTKDLKNVGDHLGRAEQAYEGALKKLSTGRGNLVAQAEMLKALGAETGKSIDEELIDRDAVALLAGSSEREEEKREEEENPRRAAG